MNRKEEILWRRGDPRSMLVQLKLERLRKEQKKKKLLVQSRISQNLKAHKSTLAKRKRVKPVIIRKKAPDVLLGLEKLDFDSEFTIFQGFRSGKMQKLGLDIGTKNIVLAYKDSEGKKKIRHEINGFIKIPKLMDLQKIC